MSMEEREVKMGEWLIERRARHTTLRRAVGDYFKVVFPLSIFAGLIVLFAEISPWFILAFVIADCFGIVWVTYNAHFENYYRAILEEVKKEEEEWGRKATSYQP